MGKSNKRRQARRQQTEHVVCAALAAHSERTAHAKRNNVPTAAVEYGDFSDDYRNKIELYRAFMLRRPEDWRCRIKSRSQSRRLLDLVRFTFARYPVPPHLENAWANDHVAPPLQPQRPAEAGREPDLRRWYIIATQGGSLYKLAAHPYLSKLETHHFLIAPAQVGTAQTAFWYAVARTQGDGVGSALRIARTRLCDHSITTPFWRDVARFFVRNPASLQEMNDLIDFLAVTQQQNASFTLKGRTLAALRRRMEEWHRELRKAQRICGGSWPGHPLDDIEYHAGSEHKRAIWRFRQIKTGNDLFREGQCMHHCVASYKERCMSGDVSIWSLTSEYPIGCINRGVTIELRKSGVIMQCRGFANRPPYANELAMVKRWAQEHGLNWSALA